MPLPVVEVIPAETAMERRLRIAVQSSPVLTLAFDFSGSITLVEGRDAVAFGHEAPELRGMSLADLDSEAPAAAEAVRRALAGKGSHITAVVRGRSCDIRCCVEADETGKVVGAVAIVNDITERLEAVDQARQREARWESLVSQSADVALIADITTTNLTYASPAVTRLFGWQPQDLMGHPGIELVHPEDLARITAALSVIAEDSSQHVTVEFRFQCADGSYRWVEESISNLADVPGVHGLVGNLRDITDRRAAEEALRQRDRVTRALAAKAEDVALVVGADGCVRYLNPSATRVSVVAEGDVLDLQALDYIHPDDRAMVTRTLTGLTTPEETARMTYRRRGVNGDWRWVEQVITNCIDDPDIRGLVVNLREITDQVEAEAALGASEARYRLIAETAQEGIWATDSEGQTLYANQKMADLLGYLPSELYAKPAWQLITGSGESGFMQRLRHREVHGGDRYDLRHTRPDGSDRILHVSVSPFAEAGRRLGSLAMVSDITDARAAEDQLRHRALHDPLTGLANRALLAESLRDALTESGSVAVLVADIDQFKLINDSFGHASGDALLMEVARRWQALLRPDELFARFGGDEFVVLCRGSDEAAARRLAARLLETLESPIEIDGRTVAANASVGIAVAAAGSLQDAEMLLRYADAAMYEAKARGRGRTEVFNPRLIERARTQLELFNDLRFAISHDQLAVNYQPIVELSTGELLGIEALCRWNHPIRGAISPERFIKAAEEGGLIAALDDWVLRRACHDAAALRCAGILSPSAYVSVNKSAFSLAQQDCEATIRAALSEACLPAQALVLEVTESAIMADPDAAQEVLESLRSLGVRVAIDDFGTGYSSLAYLRRFPVATLKIDRSFITHMSRTPDDHAIVTAIADLATALNLTTTAEGVETDTDLALLQRLGCLAGQGYLWSPALPLDQLTVLVRGLPDGRFEVDGRQKSPGRLALPPPRRGMPPQPIKG